MCLLAICILSEVRFLTVIFPTFQSCSPMEPWVAHQRRDLLNDGGEVYLPVYSSEDMPDNENLMKTLTP